jgi:hypothetical protein
MLEEDLLWLTHGVLRLWLRLGQAVLRLRSGSTGTQGGALAQGKAAAAHVQRLSKENVECDYLGPSLFP